MQPTYQPICSILSSGICPRCNSFFKRHRCIIFRLFGNPQVPWSQSSIVLENRLDNFTLAFDTHHRNGLHFAALSYFYPPELSIWLQQMLSPQQWIIHCGTIGIVRDAAVLQHIARSIEETTAGFAFATILCEPNWWVAGDFHVPCVEWYGRTSDSAPQCVQLSHHFTIIVFEEGIGSIIPYSFSATSFLIDTEIPISGF